MPMPMLLIALFCRMEKHLTGHADHVTVKCGCTSSVWTVAQKLPDEENFHCILSSFSHMPVLWHAQHAICYEC